MAGCACACAGVVVLHHATICDLLSVKMFEYLAAGLPVIASDFPLWVELFSEFKCGLNVDPHDPKAIAPAMDWMLANPEKASPWGSAACVAVEADTTGNPEAKTRQSVSEIVGLAVPGYPRT